MGVITRDKMGSSSTLTLMGWISTTTPTCHNRHLMHLCVRNASARSLNGRSFFYSRIRCSNNKDNNGLRKIFQRPQVKQNDVQSKSLASMGALMESNEELDSCPGDSSMVTTSIWNWQGYDIRYQFAGSDGPALVLIHGFGANSDHWRKNLPFLAKSHRVYAIDLLGYGYSDKPNPLDFPVNSLYTFETWAKQINEFCLDVVKDRAFFICNSIGGVVGLQAAVMERNICRGLVLLNISLRMLHIKKQSWYLKPFVKSFQDLLRNTDLGKMFYKAVATPKAVKNILSQLDHSGSVHKSYVCILLITGPAFWVLGSIHNALEVYNAQLQMLQKGVYLSFLIGSIMFLISTIVHRQRPSPKVENAWLDILASAMFVTGGLFNLVKVFKQHHWMMIDGGGLEELGYEEPNHTREGQHLPLLSGE